MDVDDEPLAAGRDESAGDALEHRHARDLDERLVYSLTKQLFVALEVLSQRGALRSMDIDQAPATPIPLHEGAARYYRERELTRYHRVARAVARVLSPA